MGKHRILVIDDNVDVCEVLKTALSDKYEVIMAHDGYAGLQKVQGCEPDLVMLDVQMPKLNGHQLCDAVKHSRKTKNTAVVFITGHGSEEDEFAAFQQGADLYFHKPFDLAFLVQEVDRVLSKITPSNKTLSYTDIMNME